MLRQCVQEKRAAKTTNSSNRPTTTILLRSFHDKVKFHCEKCWKKPQFVLSLCFCVTFFYLFKFKYKFTLKWQLLIERPKWQMDASECFIINLL